MLVAALLSRQSDPIALGHRGHGPGFKVMRIAAGGDCVAVWESDPVMHAVTVGNIVHGFPAVEAGENFASLHFGRRGIEKHGHRDHFCCQFVHIKMRSALVRIGDRSGH